MIQWSLKNLLVCFIFALALTGSLDAQESSVVSAMLEEAGGDITILDDIIKEHATLLNKYPDSEFAPTLMFQLAELHYERAQMAYQQQMSHYEEQMTAFQNGDIDTEPAMPHLDMTKTIFYCTSLLESQADVKFRDKIIYKLAVAHLDQGDQEEAKKYFSLLTEEAPDSPMALESHFRIGEYFFDKRQFDKAIKHYRVLLNHWDNPFFDMALYKLGWSYYNQANYADAISNFLVLIQDIHLVDSLQTTKQTVAQTDLRTESIYYIASSFSEEGGPDLAAEFLRPLKQKEYVPAILIKLAELYENRNAYAEAIASYRVLLDFYPFHVDAPNFFNRIVNNYEAAEDPEAALAVRKKIISYFRPGSAWQQHYPSGELSEAGLRSARDNLVYLGTTFQALAQAADSLEAFNAAIEKYIDYIQTFPKEKNTSEIHYYLAECYYSIGHYQEAAKAYNDVAKKYPGSDYREKAAFNRVFSLVQLWDAADSSATDTLVLKNFVLTGDSLHLAVNNPSAGAIIAAANDFCLKFSESKWIDQVYMKLGEVLNKQQFYVYAAAAYRRVYDQTPPSPYRPAAAINVGQCLFDGGYFDQADDWFENVSRAYADSSQLRDKAMNMAASARFKLAEQQSADNKPIAAARILLSIASGPYENKFRERALFEAAVQYRTADSLLMAARTFERLSSAHPGSDLGDKALYQAAMLRETLQDWQLAAHNYLTLFDRYTESALRQQSLKNAAQCYVNAEKWITAKNLFLRYAELFPQNYQVIEFTCQGGDMASKAGQDEEALQLYQQTLQKYDQFSSSGQPVDPYFAAQAQFMIGEIYFKEYQQIELTPPLQKNFERKVAAFNKTAKAYAEAIKFQIADWSTAASHRVGMSFEEFVRAFLQSPVPADLDQEQQTLYREKLAERARGYQEKALQTYQKNIEQAEANGIDNSWVAQSRARVRALTDELAAKTASLNKTEDQQ